MKITSEECVSTFKSNTNENKYSGSNDKLSFFIQLKFYDQKFNSMNDLYFEFYGACFIARSIWLV